MKNRKVEATGNEAPTEAENMYLEGAGNIEGGTDICGETWTVTSISSSHSTSIRIWNLP